MEAGLRTMTTGAVRTQQKTTPGSKSQKRKEQFRNGRRSGHVK